MTKLIVIGMDGATPDLLFAWIAQGKLPNLKKIMENGVSGELNSVPNQRSAAAWSTFITGINPGRHGIFEFYERLPLSHDIRFSKTSSRNGTSFWQVLSKAGRKVIVVNVPMTYPCEPVNGCMIAGLDAPGKTSPGFTYPKGLLDDIEAEVGPYIQEPGVISMVVSGQRRAAEEKILQAVRQRGKAVRYLMQRYEWDTLVAVFRETDPAQHCFWQDMQEADDPLESTIFKIYRQIDLEIGEILEAAGQDVRVLVMSDHGFGFRQHGTGCLNQWLEQAGFLAFKKESGSNAFSAVLKAGYQTLEKLLGRRAKEHLFRLVPGLISRVQSKVFFNDIDWSRTKAYGDNVMPVIWLNTSDLSPHGVPENEIGRVVDQLKHELTQNCLDSENRRPVVEQVWHRDECYSGDMVHKAPDLLIRWKGDMPIAGLCYGEQGKPLYPHYPTREFMINTGDHRPMGIFMAMGEGIERNQVIEGMNIADVPAVAVYLNELDIPADMEGDVRLQIFKASFLQDHPVKKGQKDHPGQNTGEVVYTDAEEEALKERLRGLGYLE